MPSDPEGQARLLATYQRLLWWQVGCTCVVLLALPLIALAAGVDLWWLAYVVVVPVLVVAVRWLLGRHARVMAKMDHELGR